MLNKKMGKKGSVTLFVTLISFWLILGLVSYFFDVQLSKSSIVDLKGSPTDSEQGFLEGLFTVASDIPIVNAFVPLLKMLTWQYVEVPGAISLLLDTIFIFSGFVIVVTIRGG